MAPMGPRERRTGRGDRLASRSLVAIGGELREARLQAGLIQRRVSALVGISSAEVSRIEHGRAPRVPYRNLALIASVLGLDLPLRAFPNGARVRDAGQLRLLAAFRAILPAGIRYRSEVPIGSDGDLRAWDAVIDGRGWSLPVEGETHIRDSQALRRRLALKCRDGGVDRMVLVVADTRHNRHVLRVAADEFAEAFPVPGRRAVASLRMGDPPSGSSIVLV